MRNTFPKIIVAVFFSLFALVGKAQTMGYECLGINSTISVYMNSEPTYNGYFKFIIPMPPERVLGVQGPASSYINNLGGSLEFYVHKNRLDMAADGMNCEVPFDLVVEKWFDNFSYNTEGRGTQCYYLIKLMVNYD